VCPSETSTPNGRLVFGIFATIAEFERELIRERVRSGIAVARAQGKRIGRSWSRKPAGEMGQPPVVVFDPSFVVNLPFYFVIRCPTGRPAAREGSRDEC
jgi:hypothetical protein